jgi:hypothetical protein
VPDSLTRTPDSTRGLDLEAITAEADSALVIRDDPRALNDDDLERACRETALLHDLSGRQYGQLAIERMRRRRRRAHSACPNVTDTALGESRNTTDERPDTTDVILARQEFERDGRSGRRRVRWTTDGLMRVMTLAAAEQERLSAAGAGQEGEQDLRELAQVADTARRLIAARIAPHSDVNANASPDRFAQVAYLAPVEIVVDLESGEVTQYVLIDEGVELDALEGPRASGSLNALPPVEARRAVQIAELDGDAGGEWPVLTCGF